MGIPYAFIKALEGKSSQLERGNRLPKEQMDYLVDKKHMAGLYLGACLDSCRWGAATTVMWETDVRGLMAFIAEWRRQNNDNPDLYHERAIGELYTKFSLPYINHEICPVDKEHVGRIEDVKGRVRCAQTSSRFFRPSFIEERVGGFNEFAQMREFSFSQHEPFDPMLERDNNEERIDNYLELKKVWDCEEQSVEVRDVCYAILDDSKVILPFETILQRMNLAELHKHVYCSRDEFTLPGPCKRLEELEESEKRMVEMREECLGHYEPNLQVEFPFDGWDLAFYVQKWKEQDNGNAPWFATRPERWEHTLSSQRQRLHEINADCAG